MEDPDHETEITQFSNYCLDHVEDLIEIFVEDNSSTLTLPTTYLESFLLYYSLFMFSIKSKLNNRLTDQLMGHALLRPSTDQILVLDPFRKFIDSLIAGYLDKHSAIPATFIRDFYKNLTDIFFIALTEKPDLMPNTDDVQNTIIHDIRGTKGILVGAAMLSASTTNFAEREQFIAIVRRNLNKMTDAFLELSHS